MRLICPECGAMASIGAFENDAVMREALVAITKFPKPVENEVLSYLTLFRPEKRGLSWKKARTLVAELAKIVSTGQIQVQGKVSRPCPPTIWAQAMAEMAGRRDRLQLPLKSHNYLRQVAWPLADAADATIEKKRNNAEQTGKELPERNVYFQHADQKGADDAD